MKLTNILLVFSLFILTPAQAKPVWTTSLNEAIANAPIILVVEAGEMQFDDMKEGESKTMQSDEFYCRKQKFKILRVLKNEKKQKLDLNSTISINYKSNNCIVDTISVRKKGKQLFVARPDKKDSEFSVSVYDQHEKEILFLIPSEYRKGELEHYGWFVSPQSWKESVEKECTLAHKPIKSVVQIAPDCK